MSEWSFLTNHARSLVLIADDPSIRLRDIAARLDITERNAHSIVSDLADSGYVVKYKDGRRNQYRVQTDRFWGETIGRELTIGQVLNLLLEAGTGRPD